MKRLSVAAMIILIGLGVLLLTGFGSDGAFWSQWGRNAQHTGMVSIAGQPINNKLADIVYDPFTQQEQNESGGELLAHYQATLIDGNSFYMMQKSGSYPSCQLVGLWVYGMTGQQFESPLCSKHAATRSAAENQSSAAVQLANIGHQGADLILSQAVAEGGHVLAAIGDDMCQLCVRLLLHLRRAQVRGLQGLP